MKILYIAREFGIEKTGANQVMSRNLNALRLIAGTDNVIEYYVPKTNLKTVALSMLRLGSYGVSKRHEKNIIRLVKNVKPDYVFFEGSLFGSLFKKLKTSSSQTLLFAHNLDTELSKQEISSRSSLIGFMKYKFVKFNEKRSAEYADYLICLNERDSRGFNEMFGRRADIILPITFPSRDLDICIESNQAPYYLFVGSDFFPNVEGVKWFIENVAPKVKADFRIVGTCCKNPELKNIPLPENVKLIGYAKDLNEEYSYASGVIAPIFKGSGMKTKTIEAISFGKSVFGTKEAFAGIDCDYNKIGALCETAEDFISALSLYDKSLFNKYSLEVFDADYSDKSFISKLSVFFNE